MKTSTCFSPVPRKGNLVARLRGTGKRKPILLVAHLDVVPALRSDWSVDPFKLTEQDGYFYGRGSSDDKYMAASFVTNLIRYRREGYKPDRDIILALETDEEIFDHDALGIQWLIKNHRDLIDAEFALNEGGPVNLQNGKAVRVNVQTSEKVPVTFQLDVKNSGGHSSVPRKDNAIYHLAEGLVRLSKFEFPLHLNDTTRAWFERAAQSEGEQTAADIRAVLADKPDAAALSRLSAIAPFNAQLRTTCVATMLQGGHAANALPQLATAKVNCRIIPGEPADEVKATLDQGAGGRRDRRDADRAGGCERAIEAQRGDRRRDREIVARVLAGRRGDSGDEHRRHRRRLPAQRRDPDLWTFRHGDGARRRRAPSRHATSACR